MEAVAANRSAILVELLEHHAGARGALFESIDCAEVSLHTFTGVTAGESNPVFVSRDTTGRGLSSLTHAICMKKPEFNPAWPESWRMSHAYDLEEVFGEIRNYGYAYAYQRRLRDTLKLVQSIASPPATVLDVAAGAGNFALRLAELGYTVTWNDLRADLAEYVRLKQERGTVNLAPGNAFELGFENAFDVVIINEVIEHVAHPDEFLEKTARMVRPGGHVVMTTPNGAYFRHNLPKFSECSDPSQFEALQFKPNSDGHIFLLHPDEIAGLAAKAGLKVERIRLVTNFLTHGHVKTERILGIIPRWLVDAQEAITQRLPGFLSRRIHTSMIVLFSKPS